MLSFCCTKVVRNRLRLAGTLPPPVHPNTRLGNWYLHLARFGHQQILLATSERSLLTVLLPACNRRETIETSFRASLAELLAELQVPAEAVSREIAALPPISYAAASNRRVIGSMNECIWQLGTYLTHTNNSLELSMQLSKTPMSAVGSKSSYGFPDAVARELLTSGSN